MRRGPITARRMAWVRFALGVLSLLVALGASLPAYARMAAGPKAHVCHCESDGEHAHCACPVCFPELDDDGLDLSPATLKGRCGDDDHGWRTLEEPGVVPWFTVTIRHFARTRAFPPRPVSDHAPLRRDPPDPRPPRSALG